MTTASTERRTLTMQSLIPPLVAARASRSAREPRGAKRPSVL